MTDFCLLCECEPIERDGWFINDQGDCICPWCVDDLCKKKLKEKTLKWLNT